MGSINSKRKERNTPTESRILSDDNKLQTDSYRSKAVDRDIPQESRIAPDGNRPQTDSYPSQLEERDITQESEILLADKNILSDDNKLQTDSHRSKVVDRAIPQESRIASDGNKPQTDSCPSKLEDRCISQEPKIVPTDKNVLQESDICSTDHRFNKTSYDSCKLQDGDISPVAEIVSARNRLVECRLGVLALLGSTEQTVICCSKVSTNIIMAPLILHIQQ